MSLQLSWPSRKAWQAGSRCHSLDSKLQHRQNVPSAGGVDQVASTALQSLRAAEKLETEMLALRDCLYASGALSVERYLISLHRQQFASVLKAHPLELNSKIGSFAELLSVPDLRSTTITYLRRRDTESLHVASRALCEVTRGIPYTSNTYLYLVGGYDGHQSLSCVERLEPEDDIWEVAPPMDVPRRSPSVAAVHGRLYVCGGMHDFGGRRRYLSSAESFDITTGLWEPLPNMSTERAQGVSMALDGCVYVVGGFDGRRYLASAEMYNPFSSSWSLLPSTNEPCARAVAAVVDDLLYVCGGFDGPHALASGEVFDPYTSKWELLPWMAERRRGAAGARIGCQIIVCGGFDGTDDLISVESFDTEIGVWANLAPMVHPLGEASGSALSGCLYVCGGLSCDLGSRSVAACVQCYNPESNRWELKSSMHYGRAWAASAALLDVSGGPPMWSTEEVW